MHSIAEIGTNVPAFLAKLWKMVEDPVTNDLIAWSSAGTSFVIKDEIRFARELLPMYYKHNNMASFIRQLNMYDFHKIVSPDAGSMKMETPDEIQFSHPFFMQGHPYLLDNIKRKIGVSKVLPGRMGEKTPQVINKVLSDVRQMKGRQENLDSRLTAMKLENGALWRELSVLRQKHLKQQQIVNKLIQFLVTIVHQNHNSFSVKRKYPRMLQHHNKPSSQEVTHLDDDDLTAILSDDSNSPTGPVIHELDPAEALLETVVEEAGADTPTVDFADYFLTSADRKNIDEMADNAGMPQPEDANAETILGMPEDTLINHNLNTHKRNGSTARAAKTLPHTFQLNKKMKNEAQILRPKYIKLITKKPKKSEETQPKQKQVILINPQKQMQKTLQQQLQINKNQLEINEQQLLNSEQQQIQRQQQSQLLKSQQQPLLKSSRVLVKPRLQRLVVKQPHQEQTDPEQSPKSQSQSQQRVEQTTVTQSPPSTSEPIISIPFDSGSTGNIITEVNGADLEPIYLDGSTADFSMPVVVEVPPAVPPVQPAALSPQDILISSPVLTNDPVMTPQVEPSPNVSSTPVSSPVETQNKDMQVACLEDPGASSPNILSRSAHQLFKIDPSGHSRSEMDNHVDSVQNDLDSLKELLRSEGISLDANTLLGYFNDDPLSYNLPDHINNEEPKESSGNELMACNPSFFDFTDLISNDWSLPTSPGANVATDDSFAEVNTPQFVPHSPSFPTPSKKRKK